jgi:hypothetical protein
MRLATTDDPRAAYLGHVSALNVDGVFRIATDKPAFGSNQEDYFIARRVSNGNQYMGRIRFPQDGTVRLRGAVLLNGQPTFLPGEVRVVGLSHTAGKFIWVRTPVAGTNPTTIRMPAWADGSPGPSTWPMTTTDATPLLQA